MLRRDGVYVVYRIQHYEPHSKQWVYSNFDHFGTPKGFSAADPCWQQTGIHGVFDEATACAGLKWISNPKRRFDHDPKRCWRCKNRQNAEQHGCGAVTGITFRVVLLTLFQHTQPLAKRRK